MRYEAPPSDRHADAIRVDPAAAPGLASRRGAPCRGTPAVRTSPRSKRRPDRRTARRARRRRRPASRDDPRRDRGGEPLSAGLGEGRDVVDVADLARARAGPRATRALPRSSRTPNHRLPAGVSTSRSRSRSCSTAARASTPKSAIEAATRSQSSSPGGSSSTVDVRRSRSPAARRRSITRSHVRRWPRVESSASRARTASGVEATRHAARRAPAASAGSSSSSMSAASEIVAAAVDPGVVRVPDRRVPPSVTTAPHQVGCTRPKQRVERAPEPHDVARGRARAESSQAASARLWADDHRSHVPGRAADGRAARSRRVRARWPPSPAPSCGSTSSTPAAGDLEWLAAQFGIHPVTIEDMAKGVSARRSSSSRATRSSSCVRSRPRRAVRSAEHGDARDRRRGLPRDVPVRPVLSPTTTRCAAGSASPSCIGAVSPSTC